MVLFLSRKASPVDVKLEAFQEHWRQIKPVLENTGPWSVNNRTRESIESGVLSVRANLNSLTHLLVEELRAETALGPLLEFTFEGILKKIKSDVLKVASKKRYSSDYAFGRVSPESNRSNG